jgi:cytochrome c
MKKKNMFLIALLAGLSTNAVLADQALATKSGCMACHNVKMKVVGPAIKDIAAKYKGQAGIVDTLAAKVKAGSAGGVWGQIPMPPNAHVAETDIKTVVTWMLTN